VTTFALLDKEQIKAGKEIGCKPRLIYTFYHGLTCLSRHFTAIQHIADFLFKPVITHLRSDGSPGGTIIKRVGDN